MRRTMSAVTASGAGLFSFVAGQAIWPRSPDEIWAACAVVGVLSALAIAFESNISKAITRVRRA